VEEYSRRSSVRVTGIKEHEGDNLNLQGEILNVNSEGDMSKF